MPPELHLVRQPRSDSGFAVATTPTPSDRRTPLREVIPPGARCALCLDGEPLVEGTFHHLTVV